MEFLTLSLHLLNGVYMSNIGSEKWDECKTELEKLRYVNDLKPRKVASSTKYWVRDWLRSQDWKSEDIQNALGSDWK